MEEIFVDSAYARGAIRVSEGDHVIDCGAHVGVFARFALQRGAKRVICVEMDDRNFSCLQENLRPYSDRATAHQAVLWNRPTTLSFHQGSCSDTHFVSGASDSGLAKNATSLDQLLSGMDLSRIDFIKVDVEGAEPEVVEGALETIRRYRPRLAIAVYHHKNEEERIRDLFQQHSIPYLLTRGHMATSNHILFGKPRKM